MPKWTDRVLNNTLADNHQLMRINTDEVDPADQNQRVEFSAVRTWLDVGFTQTKYVDPQSSYATPDGSISRPFAVLQDAINSIIDATNIKRYVIIVAAGTIAQSITMKPYIAIIGNDRNSSKLTGSITLPTTDVGDMLFRDITINGSITLVNSGSVACTISLNHVDVTGALQLTGRGAGSDSVIISNSRITGTVMLKGMSFSIHDVRFNSNVIVSQNGSIADSFGNNTILRAYSTDFNSNVDVSAAINNNTYFLAFGGSMASGTLTLYNNDTYAVLDATNYPINPIVYGGGAPTVVLWDKAINMFADNTANGLTSSTIQGQLDELASLSGAITRTLILEEGVSEIVGIRYNTYNACAAYASGIGASYFARWSIIPVGTITVSPITLQPWIFIDGRDAKNALISPGYFTDDNASAEYGAYQIFNCSFGGVDPKRVITCNDCILNDQETTVNGGTLVLYSSKMFDIDNNADLTSIQLELLEGSQAIMQEFGTVVMWGDSYLTVLGTGGNSLQVYGGGGQVYLGANIAVGEAYIYDAEIYGYGFDLTIDTLASQIVDTILYQCDVIADGITLDIIAVKAGTKTETTTVINGGVITNKGNIFDPEDTILTSTDDHDAIRELSNALVDSLGDAPTITNMTLLTETPVNVFNNITGPINNDIPTNLFAGTAINNRLYIGGDFMYSAWGQRITTAFASAVPYPFIIEYWNGAWIELPHMETDDSDHAQYGRSIFGVVTDGHIRHKEPSDWVLSIVNGLNRYWIRITIGTVLTTIPAADDCYLERNRVFIDHRYDNRVQYFGKCQPEHVTILAYLFDAVTFASGNGNVDPSVNTGLILQNTSRANGAKDGSGNITHACCSTDLSKDVNVVISFKPADSNAGNVELELYSSAWITGNVLNSGLTEYSNSQIVPVNGTADLVYISNLISNFYRAVPGSKINWNLVRDGTAGNPDDTYNAAIEICSFEAKRKLWR